MDGAQTMDFTLYKAGYGSRVCTTVKAISISSEIMGIFVPRKTGLKSSPIPKKDRSFYQEMERRWSFNEAHFRERPDGKDAKEGSSRC